MTDYPVTQAVRVLRAHKVEFTPQLYEYVEKGGTAQSSYALGVNEHSVIKTLVFETNEKKPLIVLMHGDLQVSTKELARQLQVKAIAPATPDRANKLTGYLVGGTSPFGTKTEMPIYAEATIFALEKIYINGGKRGFLVGIAPQALHDVLRAREVHVGIKAD